MTDMNIKERLRFIEQIQQPRIRDRQPVPEQVSIDAVIDGELITTSLGRCFVRTTRYHLYQQHGTIWLNQIRHVSPFFLYLAGKDEKLLDMDLRRALFFDTETTGLAGGSGTYIFLAGFGFFQEDQFIIKQYFLIDFPDEPATLQAVNQLLGNFNGIISFNGKSFDWPLLQTRFTYHRIASTLTDPQHLDLLHAARRIWKRRLNDCSLGSIEAEILQVRRHQDIPSALIPQLYFQYLRSRDATSLKKVFYHNEMDILSLVALTILLNQIHEQPIEKLAHDIDLSTLAHHYETSAQWQRNIPIYHALWQSATDAGMRAEIGLRLSHCYKRLGQWSEAVALWEQIIGLGQFRIEPYEELAKYYEHHQRDYAHAEQIVQRALDNLRLIDQLRPSRENVEQFYRFTHRLQRLRAKLARSMADSEMEVSNQLNESGKNGSSSR